MEVLEKSETFEEVEGVWQYAYVTIVYRIENDIYHGISNNRQHFHEPQSIKLEELASSVLIPREIYCPICSPHFTQAPASPSATFYVKRPSLLSYRYLHLNGNPAKISERVLEEVKVGEILRLNPHPNIAKYLGCLVHEGRIIGTCWTKYHNSLMDIVNPGHHMKRHVIYNDHLLKDRDAWLNGIEKGIRHLHSLGLVHNDINPANIMLDDTGTSIIIDYDSCKSIGQNLEGVGRTYEWYDESVQDSLPSNDLDALDEMRVWLSGALTKNFKFGE
ncbi:hypothetical protein EAF04_005394 [Stromatinia cepivora]|nr:hypothetical protein EAF04_005394 [Stromatinia cepivora]